MLTAQRQRDDVIQGRGQRIRNSGGSIERPTAQLAGPAIPGINQATEDMTAALIALPPPPLSRCQLLPRIGTNSRSAGERG
jgi:hypothetical protein